MAHHILSPSMGSRVHLRYLEWLSPSRFFYIYTLGISALCNTRCPLFISLHWLDKRIHSFTCCSLFQQSEINSSRRCKKQNKQNPFTQCPLKQQSESQNHWIARFGFLQCESQTEPAPLTPGCCLKNIFQLISTLCVKRTIPGGIN